MEKSMSALTTQQTPDSLAQPTPEPTRFLERPWIFVNLTGFEVSIKHDGQTVAVPSLVGADPDTEYFGRHAEGVRANLDRLAENFEFRRHIDAGAFVMYLGGTETHFGFALAEALDAFCTRIGANSATQGVLVGVDRPRGGRSSSSEASQPQLTQALRRLIGTY
jgi:hypothetical protein